ncbi:DNase I-like protein, partial [Artomyces pyxidatus]
MDEAHVGTAPPSPSPSLPESTSQTPANRKGLRTKANIKIATLNVNGRSSTTLGHGETNKWTEIVNLVRTERIGILAVQETHLGATHVDGIENLFQKNILVLNSSDPTRPTSSAGVAFVLNRAITNIEDYTFTVIVPGRAIALTTKWHNDETLTMLNVYAPNHPNQHRAFWHAIRQEWRRLHMPRLDFMLGDFNLVEDALDRAPLRDDDEDAVAALRNLRTELNLRDTWRHAYPDTRMFTFRSSAANNHAASRLDRIYIAASQEKHAFEWASAVPSVPTDHAMVSVRFAPKLAPHIGAGRPTFPLHLLHDRKFMSIAVNAGKQLESLIAQNEDLRTEENNPQTLLLNYKTQI